VLSEAIIESCLKISLNRERTRIEMSLREHVSNAEIFLNTLLVNMKFLNPLAQDSDLFQKRKHDMERVSTNITSADNDSESDDMIKFLAIVRKLGIDIM
jgi:transcriptional regulator of met regulon